MAATPLLIHDAAKAIQYNWAILNFTILAQYVLHDKETLHYIKHKLYKLEKKLTFEQYRPINSKLCQPTFNYSKFHTISHFVQFVWDYGSAVNYDTAYVKTAHKSLLKAFYNKINKKEYKSQIWQHNMRHTNIIAMKDVIILEKTRKKEKLSEGLTNITAPAKVAQTTSFVDLA